MNELSSSDRELMDRATAEPMLDQVQRWAVINSGSGNLIGLKRMADILANAFSALPGKIQLSDPAEVEAIAPDGKTGLVPHGRHLLLSVRPQAPIQLLLTGHMDTVFGAEHPFQSVRLKSSTELSGPGVSDMKGGLAVMLAALKAFETATVSKRIGYDVIINSDEELGSPSSASLLRHTALGKAAALTYEPSLPDGTLAGARSGSGNFSFTVNGRSAHAGRNPQEGRNALLAAADLALRLSVGSGGGFTCNPARIDGGGPNNVIPANAVLRVNFRPRTAEAERSASQLIARSISEVARDHDVRVKMHGGFGRPPKPMDPASASLFQLVRRCGAELGLPINWRDTGGVCDGNNIAACGVPVVDTMGVRGGNIHTPEEYLIVDSLAERARLSALTLLRIAQGEFSREAAT